MQCHNFWHHFVCNLLAVSIFYTQLYLPLSLFHHQIQICLSKKDIVNGDFHEYFKYKDVFMLSYHVEAAYRRNTFYKYFLEHKLFKKVLVHPKSEGKSIHLVWSITLSADDLFYKTYKKICFSNKILCFTK